MTVNNFDVVSQFLPGQPKGPRADMDKFLYTELLDRTKRVGNNGVRIVKTFYHRDIDDFTRHFPLMQMLCDATGARAYTRLSPRSFEKVGKLYARMVTEAVVSENWAGMKSLYTRACGTVTPARKLWLFDVDEVNSHNQAFGKWLQQEGLLEAVVPSKRAYHYVTPAFDLRRWDCRQDPAALTVFGVGDMTLHKDNAVNLYIPDNAA